MTNAAQRAALEIARQVFPAFTDGSMSEYTAENSTCVRRLARIIDDEFAKEKVVCPSGAIVNVLAIQKRK